MQTVKTNKAKEQTTIANGKLSSISEIRNEIKKKVKEDLFRFRTCCADPRASK